MKYSKLICAFIFLYFSHYVHMNGQSLGMYSAYNHTLQLSEPNTKYLSKHGLSVGIEWEKRIQDRYLFLIDFGYNTSGFERNFEEVSSNKVVKSNLEIRKHLVDIGVYPFGVKVKPRLFFHFGIRSQLMFYKEGSSLESSMLIGEPEVITTNEAYNNYGRFSIGPSFKSTILLISRPTYQIKLLLANYMNFGISSTQVNIDGLQSDIGLIYVFKV